VARNSSATVERTIENISTELNLIRSKIVAVERRFAAKYQSYERLAEVQEETLWMAEASHMRR
jgi:hypothetical protein